MEYLLALHSLSFGPISETAKFPIPEPVDVDPADCLQAASSAGGIAGTEWAEDALPAAMSPSRRPFTLGSDVAIGTGSLATSTHPDDRWNETTLFALMRRSRVAESTRQLL